MYKLLTYLIALVWLANGLLCKVLNLVPRHQQIVAAILGNDHAGFFTVAIGMGEIAIAIWIIWHRHYKLCAVIQIALVLTMNIIEFFAVPEYLLWGKLNIIFAAIFATVIYIHAFKMNQIFKNAQKSGDGN